MSLDIYHNNGAVLCCVFYLMRNGAIAVRSKMLYHILPEEVREASETL